MAENTNISWTDHTFNPWWGCTRIAPGCDNCYAAALDKRTGGDHWDPHTAPRITKDAAWRKLRKLHAEAERIRSPKKVFCGSMMDWCDNQVSNDQRIRLFAEIAASPWFDWQLLTKRASRILDSIPAMYWPSVRERIWLGVTVENRKHGYPRIDHLREVLPHIRFLSCEPLLEDLKDINLQGIHWVIIGGESGPGARKMEPEWVLNLIRQCDAQSVPVWFKQWGGAGRDKGGQLVEGRLRQDWPRGYIEQMNNLPDRYDHGATLA